MATRDEIVSLTSASVHLAEARRHLLAAQSFGVAPEDRDLLASLDEGLQALARGARSRLLAAARR